MPPALPEGCRQIKLLNELYHEAKLIYTYSMVGTKVSQGSKNPEWWKKNISKQSRENHVFLKLFFEKKLPLPLKKRIIELRKKPPQQTEDAQKELNSLINEISILGNLPTEYFSQAIEIFILHNIIRAPALNFYITDKENVVSVNFVKKPKKEDWKAAEAMVRQAYEAKPKTPRFNPNLYKNISRQVKNSKTKFTWNKVERDDKSKDITIKNATQKRNITKQDKHRMDEYVKRFDSET